MGTGPNIHHISLRAHLQTHFLSLPPHTDRYVTSHLHTEKGAVTRERTEHSDRHSIHIESDTKREGTKEEYRYSEHFDVSHRLRRELRFER